MMFEVKIPRYVHMAKYHEARGELGEAEYYYMTLASGLQSDSGRIALFGSVIYEMAKLNHHHEVPHSPDLEIIYNSVGRGTQVYFLYSNALEAFQRAVGEMHPAFARCLYGLATLCVDSRKVDEAINLLKQAFAVQAQQTDPLPAALTATALADAFDRRGDKDDSITFYTTALALLPIPSPDLQALEKAAELCKGSGEDPLMPLDAVNLPEALAIQKVLADPYFLAAFDLFDERSPELVAMMLELHRHQYGSEYRLARGSALAKLGQLHRSRGNTAEAVPLLREAAELLTET
jgi:tetratricopeptide (TPR) repeat protein